MNIKMYEYPLLIAKEGSLSRAAQKLHISQAALSHFLSSLETQLGYTLFERSTRYLAPTPTGRVYLAAAEQIVDTKQRTYQAIHRLKGHYESQIILATSPHNSAELYSHLFREFSLLYPDIQLIHREGYSHQLEKALENKSIQFYLGNQAVGVKARGQFLRFARQEILLAVSEIHPLSANAAAPYEDPSSLSLREVSEIPFIKIGSQTAVSRLIDHLFAVNDFSPLIVFQSANIALVREMIHTGLGIGLLPARYVYSRPGLRYYSLHPKVWLYMGLYFQDGHTLTEYEKHLVCLCYQLTERERLQPHFIMDPDARVQEILSMFS